MTDSSQPPKTGDARLLWDVDTDQFDAILRGDRELLDAGETANYKCALCGGALITTDQPDTFECVRCGEIIRETAGEEHE